MKHEELAKAYEHFFVKSEAGNHFMAEINRLLDDNHKEAENKPELARDCMQRAKGIRDLANHIQSVMTEVKKGPRISA